MCYVQTNILWAKQIFPFFEILMEFALERLRENSAGSCPIDGRKTSRASQQIINYSLDKGRERKKMTPTGNFNSDTHFYFLKAKKVAYIVH